MKKIAVCLLVLMIYTGVVCAQMQMPKDIQRILEKASTGKELTEQENIRLEEWGNTLEQQYGEKENKKGKDALQAHTSEPPMGKTFIAGIGNPCPEKIKLAVKPPLTRAGYVQLAQSLMTLYGPKTGDLQKLRRMLEKSVRQTDGADMGAAFVMSGAGSASVYAIAWSAARSPDDLLTANNLGVALKDMGDYSQALQVLQYADQLKPNIGIVLCNMGWTYREVGDNANATLMFEKALRVAPKMSSPWLGLGLIAQCENNHLKAEQYLRKALGQKFSEVGLSAMKQAQAAKSPSQSQSSQPRPLTNEKGNVQGLNIPDLPVHEDVGKMVEQKRPFERYHTQLTGRKSELMSQLHAVMERMRIQQMRATEDPGNAVVFQRDFSKEIMHINDIAELLLGENSNYGRALQQGSELLKDNAERMEQHLPTITQMMEQLLQLQNDLSKLIEELAACGNNESCQKKVVAKIEKVQYEAEQLQFRLCKLQKSDLESTFSAYCRYYTLVASTLNEAIPDFYAFTNPIIERIYAPALNEYYNIYRELIVIIHLETNTVFAAGIPPLADQLNQMICVEPAPPDPPVEVDEAALSLDSKKECPLGENGIGGGIGPLSFELSCDHVKLSGGEGLLWSVKRDFNKHETTIWGGVGVKGEYGSGNITAEATLGMEITIGQGDAVKDVAFTSSVKAGLGGLVEGEVSGRFALEGGPSIDASAGMSLPSISDLLSK